MHFNLKITEITSKLENFSYSYQKYTDFLDMSQMLPNDKE